MVGYIVTGGVFVLIVAGFWFTRSGAKGPTPGDAQTRTMDFASRIGPTGEPMGLLDDDSERD